MHTSIICLKLKQASQLNRHFYLIEDSFLGTVFQKKQRIKISELIPEWFILVITQIRFTQVTNHNAPFNPGLI